MGQTRRTSNQVTGRHKTSREVTTKLGLTACGQTCPTEAVVTGPNRDGRTLVGYYDSWTGHSGIPNKVIKCFMPGTMT